MLLTLFTADMDRKFFLTILDSHQVKINAAVVAQAMCADGITVTTKAVSEHMLWLKKKAKEQR